VKALDSLPAERVQELAVEAARSSLLAFLQFVWWMPQPLRVGRHTAAICDRLTRATFDWLEGRSTYLLINCPFRHGKTDAVSRAFVPWFLGVCADRQPDVILSGYGSTLVEGISRQCQAIMRSVEYRMVFPGVALDPARGAADEWGVARSAGTVVAVGLGGAITGKGGHLIILDDYCKSREEAYSETFREKTWQAFSVDLMSRRNAPASITIVMATPWHPDDVTGRIIKAVADDPLFPRFEHLTFPAHKPGEYSILFPEMYSREWYDGQRATLGPTMAAALLDCNPVGDETRMFRREWWQSCERMPARELLNAYIFVDSANAQRKTSDFTVMWVVGLGQDRNYYLLDGIRDRLNLSQRTRALFRLVEQWTPITTFWEQVGAMSDVQHIQAEQDAIGWHFPILPFPQSVKKQDRIGWLVPLFEAGRIWVPNRMLKVAEDGRVYDLSRDLLEQEFSLFPATAHDDMLDTLANVQHPAITASMAWPVSPVQERGRWDDRVVARTTGAEWSPW